MHVDLCRYLDIYFVYFKKNQPPTNGRNLLKNFRSTLSKIFRECPENPLGDRRRRKQSGEGVCAKGEACNEGSRYNLHC